MGKKEFVAAAIVQKTISKLVSNLVEKRGIKAETAYEIIESVVAKMKQPVTAAKK